MLECYVMYVCLVRENGTTMIAKRDVHVEIPQNLSSDVCALDKTGLFLECECAFLAAK